MTRKKRRRRERPSREQVRKNASQGGASWLKLPKNVREWAPDKKGSVKIDVFPYEVSSKKHPDKVRQGVLWYKYPYTVHHGVGVNNDSYVCPLSIGKKCPIHEDYHEFMKTKKDTKEDDRIARLLKGQTFVMMNIRDPDNRKRVAVYNSSWGKFWGCDAGLKQELFEGDEENCGFFLPENGKTLIVRFSKKKWAGKTFFQATNIQFKDRRDLDEDLILGKTVDLDKALIILSYKELKALHLEEDEEEEEEYEEDEEEDEEDEEEEYEEDEDEEEEEEEDEEDEEDEEEEDEEDEDEEDEEEDEEEEEEEEPPKRRKKTKKKPRRRR
jgi:hypothetical protein